MELVAECAQMTEEKAPYDVGEARRVLAEADTRDTQACAAEVTAVLKRWGRDLAAEAFITPDGRIATRIMFVIARQE